MELPELPQDRRLPGPVIDLAKQPEAPLQAVERRIGPTLLPVYPAQVEERQALPAAKTHLLEPGEALLQPADGGVEMTEQHLALSQDDQALQLPPPVACLPERLHAFLDVAEPVIQAVADVEQVAEPDEDPRLLVTVASAAGRHERQHVRLLPVVPVGTELEEPAQCDGQPAAQLPQVRGARLAHRGDLAGALGLEPARRVAPDGDEGGMLQGAAVVRVAAQDVDAARHQQAVGMLGQERGDMEHPLQHRQPRRPRLLVLKALPSKGA